MTLSLVFFAAGAFGCLFMMVAIVFMPSFARRERPARIARSAVSILKPLHGDEPSLFDNLASFCNQDYPGEVQIIFGVTNPHDPAVRVVERLRSAFPGRRLELVVNAHIAGSNPKVANLINMSSRVRHEIIVLADADIRVEPDYLARVVSALEQSGAGAVTCPYFGIPTGNVWSQLARLAIDNHFLPNVIVGVRCKLAQPCFGSTIALRSTSLAAIGGFEAVADCLADDYALCEALRKRGEPIAVLPFAVGHSCNETSCRELWRHELRWAMTIRMIDPLGYAGSALTHAFPLALAALLFGGGLPALALTLAALACRVALLIAVERSWRLPAHPYWLIPFRDLLSVAVFIAGFFARDVDWKGRRYRLASEGALMSQRRSSQP
ncbi:MAG: bacteriohopanetetrol glucosamine biosynthesis glycosyltransferase HpnI [Methylocystis sp.]|nr:bacteriohopanetetrol glucosamine biosynthesis glycosyltransferase HpnI [Methylocystis sp.]